MPNPMGASSRVRREMQEVMTEDELKNCKIHVETVDENLRHLKGTIGGPPDTPYEGGTFFIDICIPDEYPFTPPKMTFITKIWHPNISSVTGVICLDVLSEQWCASMTLRTLLLSIQSLLQNQEADDPQDAIVARQFRTQPEIYYKTAEHWTTVYASGPKQNPDFIRKTQKLMELGIESDRATMALSFHNWDLEKCTEEIFK